LRMFATNAQKPSRSLISNATRLRTRDKH